MLSDSGCIKLINEAYSGGTSWDGTFEIDYVKVFVKEYSDCRVIVFPGSQTFLDWVRDFQADMRDDPDLDGLEWGFQQGIREVLKTVQPSTDKPTIVTGHSLGAARALIYGGYVATFLSSIKDYSIITFGSPRPGGGKLRKVLSGVEQRSYRNCTDPVCSVPFYIPWFRPYQHPTPLINVFAPPPPNDPWGHFAEHHSTLYQAALEKLYA